MLSARTSPRRFTVSKLTVLRIASSRRLPAPPQLIALPAAAQSPIPKSIDRANMDTTCSACTDFFEYANGIWLRTARIPASKTSLGSFSAPAAERLLRPWRQGGLGLPDREPLHQDRSALRSAAARLCRSCREDAPARRRVRG